MPESITSLPEARCSALAEFVRKRAAPESSKTQCHGRRTPPICINGDRLKTRKGQADVQPCPSPDDKGSSTKTRGRGARTNPEQSITANAESPPQAPSRKPGSSIYYGVRFRPDLNKWVAEIRVAEWKAVDKKVWLGTFDTEKCAARGVDLARKLLKCKKKHDYNLPCHKLEAYSGQIPSHLILTDVATSSMFKDATLFIKRECQAYAASFLDPPTPSAMATTLITPDHVQAHIHLQETPATPNIVNHLLSQTSSIRSELLDDVVTDSSDDDMPEFYHTNDSNISINDYLNDCYSFDHMAMSQLGSSPSSCTSTTTSCMTFDQQCIDVAEWEMSPPSSLIADHFGAAGCIMSTGMMQGAVQGGVSQECWTDQCTWPGLGSFSSELAPLPGSYYEMTPYMSYVDDALMDCPDLTFPNFHYPFQHGSNK